MTGQDTWRPMTSTTFRVLGATFVLGCSGSAERPSAVPVPSASAPSSTSAPAPAEPTGPLVYDLHEWGLIDVYPNPDGQTSQSDVMGGPSVVPEADNVIQGLPPAAPGRPSAPSRPSLRRKPVLYLHHVSGPVSGHVELGVRVSNGRMLEVWPSPAAPLAPGQATFAFDFESVTGCVVQANLSSLCSGSPAPDGFCERLELHDYETSDANCLSVGDQHVPFLFYRADRANERLSEYPVQLSALNRAPAARDPRRESPPGSAPLDVVRAEFSTGDVSHFYRIRYESGSAHISSGSLSAQSSIPGVSVAVPSDRSATEAQCRQDLTALGLTTSESDAFMRAWANELFGGQGVADSEVLLYWLPASHYHMVSTIDATPAARTFKRALMVRLQLTSQPTDHPILVSPRRARAAFAEND